ncbi:MAG: ABC transporter substrate binding protein [Pseudomonadota bacterium]
MPEQVRHDGVGMFDRRINHSGWDGLMKRRMILCLMLMGTFLISFNVGVGAKTPGKKRLIVVDSYHGDYLWSQYTHHGFCDAMLRFGYFDSKDQIAEYTRKDALVTSKVVLKKLWMDTKRKESHDEKVATTLRLTRSIRAFEPDLIFLGEDNAADYIGNQFLDTGIPMVFWGVNNTPVKYGLLENARNPGHNVTGVYQTTYYAESLAFLKRIVPRVKTFAVLSDDTTTGRIFTKTIKYLDRKGSLPLFLGGTVSTNSFEKWIKMALELQKTVDAFFVAQYAGLKDKEGKPVSDRETAAWYLNHIKIPEATGFKHRVADGMLCAADDSGYNQGFEAVVIAHDILAGGASPASYPSRVPKRGPLIVNRQRAKMLGITLTGNMGIEEYIEEAAALKTLKR